MSLPTEEQMTAAMQAHIDTDPCLFDWRKPEDFDGSFRYVQEPKPKRRHASDDWGA